MALLKAHRSGAFFGSARKAALLALVLCLLAAVSPALTTGALAQAQDESLNAEKIKAGLLYNFLKYTDWPARAAAHPLTVCLYRADSFGGSLDQLNGRTAQQHRIRVVTVAGAGAVKDCSLLYIPAGEGAAEALAEAKEHAILTMSDRPGFARDGGMVELATRDDQRIHIVINRAAIADAGLAVQPRLTRLAEVLEP